MRCRLRHLERELTIFWVHTSFHSIRTIGQDWPGRNTLPALLSEKDLFVNGEYAWVYAENFGKIVSILGADNSEVHDVIRRYANHENPYYRTLAPFALAIGWQNAPDTFAQLEKAAGDPTSDVRWVGIYALADYFGGHTQTASILSEHASKDENPSVRYLALGKIRFLESIPDLRPLLRDRITNDADSDIRLRAQNILTEMYDSDPETLSLLQQIANEDPSETVIEAARENIKNLHGINDDLATRVSRI